MIDNHVPDGTFVNEVAELVNPEFRLQNLKDGRQILTGGADFTPEVYGEKLLPEPKALRVSTLTGIVEFYKAGIHTNDNVVILVLGPDRVTIIAPRIQPKITEQAYIFASAEPHVPQLNSGEFKPIDLFILHVLTNFIDTPERARLLASAGNLSNGIVSEIEDDGVAQSVQTRKGITQLGKERFQNPVQLQPYRTFSEIEQPVSDFVFRMQSIRNGENETTGIQGALFEADGGVWRTDAIAGIGSFLREQLPDAVILA